ncbi:hypothetical protein ACPCK8_32680 [Streptomyces cellulosae]
MNDDVQMSGQESCSRLGHGIARGGVDQLVALLADLPNEGLTV